MPEVAYNDEGGDDDNDDEYDDNDDEKSVMTDDEVTDQDLKTIEGRHNMTLQGMKELVLSSVELCVFTHF